METRYRAQDVAWAALGGFDVALAWMRAIQGAPWWTVLLILIGGVGCIIAALIPQPRRPEGNYATGLDRNYMDRGRMVTPWFKRDRQY